MTTDPWEPDPLPEPEVLAGAGPADAVATVWYQLGYRPADSLVMVGLHEPRGRVGLVLRSDLPSGLDAQGRRELIRRAYEPIRATGAVRVLVMVFHEGLFETRPSRRPPLREAQIRAEIRRLGGSVTDVIGVGRETYRSLVCRNRMCCPAGGFPIAEIESSRAAATFTAQGRAPAASREALVDDVRPDPGDDQAFQSSPSAPVSWDAADRLEHWARWVRACDRGAVEDGEAAALGPGLDDPWLRDAVVLTGLGGDHEVIRAGLERSDDGWAGFVESGFGPEFDDLLDRNPDTERRAALLERARVVLSTVARRSAPGARAGALAVLALHAWHQGDTTRARLLVDLAFADQPEQSLGRLVDQLLQRGTVPAWLPNPWAGDSPGRV